MTSLRELKSLYEQGENITEFLRSERGLHANTPEIIEIAYDLQTGSYIDAMQDPEYAEYKSTYTQMVADKILQFTEPSSILEAGVGEATTLSGVLSALRQRNPDQALDGLGFDLSWSRVCYARKWLADQAMADVQLCCGDLLHIPFRDRSVDVVYTSHSIEPNGGNETPILKELYRIAKKFLILLEPGYELASAEAKQRMDRHGYCKNLPGICNSLGYDVLEHQLISGSAQPLNPTAMTVIAKPADDESETETDNYFACPKTQMALEAGEGVLFSPESLTAYPIIGGVPCLRIENGILASRYEEVRRECLAH